MINKFSGLRFSAALKRATSLSILTLAIFTGCQNHDPLTTNITSQDRSEVRERISINEGWKFMRFAENADSLIYDVRPEVTDRNDNKAADSKPTESVAVISNDNVLKKWVLPTANDFIADPSQHHIRPEGDPGSDFPFVQNQFKDQSWETVDLPHDWAIKGPFYKEGNAIVGGGMGRLPIHGVGWYRKKLFIPKEDQQKEIYLDIDGAMSYAIVWFNGHLIGGWPYGYNSFRLNLTPYIKYGEENQIAIRLDNPANSSRWYPGAGIYRNVWITKVNQVHIGQWGSFVTTPVVTADSAVINLSLDIENHSGKEQHIRVEASIYQLNEKLEKAAQPVATAAGSDITAPSQQKTKFTFDAINIAKPALWGPAPSQKPHLYVVVTDLYIDNKKIDSYETRFGIRKLDFNPVKGLLVNGEAIRIQGVNQHHDLGALGAAFNRRAAERQLEILQELGVNAVRLAHNPPAPELLDLTDSMGILVINEIFDSWERKKTPLDFHLIFPDWHEADTRSFVRRDRNHPSIISWSFGNEVGEQYTAEAGAKLAKKLHDIVKEEDSTRPTTASMNYAKPDMPFPASMDIISLNYQGEGIRDAPAYQHLQGIRTAPLYPAFHSKFPGKLIVSSETASALSTRGTYLFPVFEGNSAPVSEGAGGNARLQQVSAYELYTSAFGASADKVFTSQDRHPYVAGEFVWSGWDYLGEPTPYYSARSSYSGIIDLAGFKKDRFYLYQARWRPELKMAYILPHWTWPDRIGQITPVHVFSSADEAELFLNNQSLGKKKRGAYEYRFRWDNVEYQPGTLHVVTYKNGEQWATDTVYTTDKPAQLQLSADRSVIHADGTDLSFITVRILDKDGHFTAFADNRIEFTISGPGEIVATDNGNPADLEAFPSTGRNAFSGLALVIVKAKKGASGTITIEATSKELKADKIVVSIR